MTQQLRIDSETLRDKLNNLLPSQSRGSINVDLSGQTTIVPIVDLTETAEGSDLRQDLQRALSHGSATTFSVTNATTTVINTTGYYRITAGAGVNNDSSSGGECRIILNDGTTDKIVWSIKNTVALTNNLPTVNVDYTVFLAAGDSLIIESTNTESHFVGSVRQIATISGELVNPV